MTSPIKIVAVLVLYRVQLAQSTSYRSLAQAMPNVPGLQQCLQLIVCDNSPEPSPVPAGFSGTYHHQPANPGLAASYNLALNAPEAAGATWLMLLDQDTVVTEQYLQEVQTVAGQYRDDLSMAAAVPKLMERGIVQSPHAALTTLRPQPLSPAYSGFPTETLHMYNSGALLRVSSLRAIGGFPVEFWLDFLDHATFHLLRASGGRVLVLHAQLEHSLSTNAPMRAWDTGYLKRHRNVLDAELLFYQRYGSPQERRWYRLRLLRLLYGALKHARLPIAWQLLHTAVRSVPWPR